MLMLILTVVQCHGPKPAGTSRDSFYSNSFFRDRLFTPGQVNHVLIVVSRCDWAHPKRMDLDPKNKHDYFRNDCQSLNPK